MADQRSALLASRGRETKTESGATSSETLIQPATVAGVGVILVAGVVLSLAALGIYHAADARQRYPYA